MQLVVKPDDQPALFTRYHGLKKTLVREHLAGAWLDRHAALVQACKQPLGSSSSANPLLTPLGHLHEWAAKAKASLTIQTSSVSPFKSTLFVSGGTLAREVQHTGSGLSKDEAQNQAALLMLRELSALCRIAQRYYSLHNQLVFVQSEKCHLSENKQTEFKGDGSSSVQNPSTFEWLRRALGFHKIERYAAAFLNAEGGSVFFGIEDGGRVRGVTLLDDERDEICLNFESCLRNVQPFPVGRYTVDWHRVITTSYDRDPSELNEKWRSIFEQQSLELKQLRRENAKLKSKRRDGKTTPVTAEQLPVVAAVYVMQVRFLPGEPDVLYTWQASTPYKLDASIRKLSASEIDSLKRT
jgi:hypothetical protein